MYGTEICVDCPKHNIIIVDDIAGDEIIFCFDKITDAKRAYAEIEVSNEFAGFHLSPNTAIFLVPKEGE